MVFDKNSLPHNNKHSDRFIVTKSHKYTTAVYPRKDGRLNRITAQKIPIGMKKREEALFDSVAFGTSKNGMIANYRRQVVHCDHELVGFGTFIGHPFSVMFFLGQHWILY